MVSKWMFTSLLASSLLFGCAELNPNPNVETFVDAGSITSVIPVVTSDKWGNQTCSTIVQTTKGQYIVYGIADCVVGNKVSSSQHFIQMNGYNFRRK